MASTQTEANKANIRRYVDEALNLADGIVVENWGLHDHASVLAQLRAES